ncbi:MAG: DUF4407 domain-containing protein [Chitinophagaceae bacterium]|nr:DUF4407 domain-containing protein [Chitinophagaceae bacterium]
MAADTQGKQESLYTYDSFSGTNNSSSKSNFLWWCAGAHQQLLKDLPSEHSKYAGLGGVILATFVLAALSSGYAIYSVFGHWGWTILFASVWGLIIFNFDRFLVSTMRKYGVSKRKQFWMALPRVVLALIIGLTIARPLELKIFEKEIAVKVTENLHKKILLNDSLLQKQNDAAMQSATAERNRLMNRKSGLEDTLHRLQQAYVQEADGTAGSMHRGIENLTRLKMDAYSNAFNQFSPELIQLEKGIYKQDSILNTAKEDLQAKRKRYEVAVQENIGFLERNKALSDLSNEESSVLWTSFFISLLIILIEIGPILSKLIMPVGPYDIALAKEELSHMASAENEMRKDKELINGKQKAFYENQKEVSDQLAKKLTAMQQKHIDEELEKWERGEWDPKNYRASMDEVMRKIKERYKYNEEDLL